MLIARSTLGGVGAYKDQCWEAFLGPPGEAQMSVTNEVFQFAEDR